MAVNKSRPVTLPSLCWSKVQRLKCIAKPGLKVCNSVFSGWKKQFDSVGHLDVIAMVLMLQSEIFEVPDWVKPTRHFVWNIIYLPTILCHHFLMENVRPSDIVCFSTNLTQHSIDLPAKSFRKLKNGENLWILFKPFTEKAEKI